MRPLQKYLNAAWALGLFAAVTLTPAVARAQQPMLGEIRFVPYTFAPIGWAECNGQLLSIAQNTALFSLLGTKYGGNGFTSFALPDLRGRSPIGDGQGFGLSMRALGESGGTEAHALTVDEMPLHAHVISDHAHAIPQLAVDVKASSASATATTASGNVLATATLLSGGNPKVTNIYAAGPADVSLAAGSTTGAGTTSSAGGTTANTGKGVAYPIRAPYLTVKCIIALQGDYPVP